MERLQLNKISPDELKTLLTSHGIQVNDWGHGESKTVAHLLQELHKGESTLQETEDGRLLRVVRGVGINVFYRDGNKLLRLREIRQVFSDGRERRRSLSTSVGEKMAADELPNEAGARALSEELGISSLGLSANYSVVDREVIPSTSFPGLWTKNTVYVFDRLITPEEYKSEGYVETQTDKTNYYAWQEVLASA